jgi:hypothetical protein
MNNSLLQLNETIKLIDLRNKLKNLTSIINTINNFKKDGFKNKKFHLIKTKQQLNTNNLNGNYELEMCVRIAVLIFSMVNFLNFF